MYLIKHNMPTCVLRHERQFLNMSYMAFPTVNTAHSVFLHNFKINSFIKCLLNILRDLATLRVVQLGSKLYMNQTLPVCQPCI